MMNAAKAASIAGVVLAALFAPPLSAQIAPITTCDNAGIGSAPLVSDLPTLPSTVPPGDTSVTITSVSTGITGGIPYCLVKVLVKPAINIWVGLPTGGNWNGRLQSEGGGGYAGSVGVPNGSIAAGYVGVQTDTGHTGGSGTFGMLTPVPSGAPDTQLQTDFAYRSEHLMAVLGKQLTQAFYGQQPAYSYWNGCSTGGRQGMRMVQDFPNDYDGVLAAAPAFHWDRFIAAEIWPQVAMNVLVGAPIANAKLTLATNAAIAACDAQDGVVDNLLRDPLQCTYNANALVTNPCTSNSCLTANEAAAINKIWQGPVNAKGKQLWYGLTRGSPLNGLGGTNPFAIAVAHARFWTYFDPAFDWHTLTFANYEAYFKKAMQMINPMMSTENPNLSAFKNGGGKLVMWHGLADQLIFPEGTTLYYDAVVNTMGGPGPVQDFFRLFLAPGVNHCGGGAAPQPQNLLGAVVNWVENGVAPESILASRNLGGGATQSRPLCVYPKVAKYNGSGSTDDAANFTCANP